MFSYKMKEQDVPAWYELATDGPTLIIRVHPMVIEFIHTILTCKSPIVSDLKEEFDLPNFIFLSEEQWGYGPIISVTDSKDDWICWHCTMPQASEPDPDAWKAMYAASATLMVIFNMLNIFDKDTGYEKSQLLTIDGFHLIKQDIYGALISAALSKRLVHWIEQQTDQSRPDKIGTAIEETLFHIWQDLSKIANQ